MSAKNPYSELARLVEIGDRMEFEMRLAMDIGFPDATHMEEVVSLLDEWREAAIAAGFADSGGEHDRK